MSCTERCPKHLSPTEHRRAEAPVLRRRCKGELVSAAVARAGHCCGSRSARRAAVLALCVLVHLVTIIYAVRERPHRRRDPRAHARQRRLDRVLRALRARRRGARADRPAQRAGANGLQWRGRSREIWRCSLFAARARAVGLAGGVRGGRRMRNDFRARSHPAYWAFIVHRVSGVALALFLPLHFWALGAGARRARRGSKRSCAGPTAARQSSAKSRSWSARRAPGRRAAAPRARVPAVARLAEDAGRGRRRDDAWRGLGLRAGAVESVL